MPTNSTSYWGTPSCGGSTNSINENGVGRDDGRRAPLVALGRDSPIGSSREPVLLVECRPPETLLHPLVRHQFRIAHWLRRLPRGAAGRVTPAVSTPADGRSLRSRTAGP